MSNESINLNKIIRESRDTLLNPKEYFLSMPLEGGFAEPVIKAAIYGTVAGIFAMLWSLAGLYDFGFGFMGGALGLMALISSIIGAIIGVFVGGALMLIVSAICGGNTDYEANVRVAASLMVIYPINTFLSFLNGINITLGSVAGLVVSLYGIYLLYISATLSLKGKESSVKIVAIVLVVLSLIGALGSRKVTKTFEEYEDMYREEQLEEADQLE
jgi:hypothetical protein